MTKEQTTTRGTRFFSLVTAVVFIMITMTIGYKTIDRPPLIIAVR